MAKLEKSQKRERQQRKRRHGMRRSGDSVKVIQTILIQKGAKK